jgi:protein TonB
MTTLKPFVNAASNNLTLNVAIAVSVLVHAVLLAIQFTNPDAFRFKATAPELEVILVNSKHEKKPVKADALAQANLDGGGNADAGRAKSPLPDMGKLEDGDSMEATKRRLVELEERQQRMYAQLSNRPSMPMPPPTKQEKPKEAQQQTDGAELAENLKALKRLEAEIAKRIEDENKRPKKTFLSPSTLGVDYAVYYNAMRSKIEKMGEYSFPHDRSGRKLYGSLIMTISVDQDGLIYQAGEQEGIMIDISSGNAALDAAAKRIVIRSAPFGKIPKNIRTPNRRDVFVMVTKFTFTRENTLETEIRGANN